MRIQFKKLTIPVWRWRPGHSRDYQVAHCRALVDGHIVTATAGKGWYCDCGDETCGHVDAVADLIAPQTLALLDGDRHIPMKEKTR